MPKISELTSVTPTIDDIIPVVDNADSSTKKSTLQLVRDLFKSYFDTIYQSLLVSGTNIKTINGSSVLGSGNLTVGGGDMLKSENLSGLTNYATARNNLGLGNVDNTSDATKNSATATLSNKTIVKPTIGGSVQNVVIVSATVGGTTSLDLSTSNCFIVNLGGNTTMAITNATVGQHFWIQYVQDATGSRTVTQFSTIKWAGGTAPTLTTTGAKKDWVGHLCTSAGNYDGVIIGQNI